MKKKIKCFVVQYLLVVDEISPIYLEFENYDNLIDFIDDCLKNKDIVYKVYQLLPNSKLSLVGVY